jgi:hypothetical protein
MTKIVRITTDSETYLIEISVDDPVYQETLLPIFNQLSVQDNQSVALDKENLISFTKQMKHALENHIQQYQPGKGRGREKIIFGKKYFLTLLNRTHNTIATLSDIYNAADECVQTNIALRFEYS